MEYCMFSDKAERNIQKKGEKSLFLETKIVKGDEKAEMSDGNSLIC